MTSKEATFGIAWRFSYLNLSLLVHSSTLQVLGKPSAELAAKMSSEEKERVANQQQSLGKEGLEEKGQQLEKAIAQNEVFAVKRCNLSYTCKLPCSLIGLSAASIKKLSTP